MAQTTLLPRLAAAPLVLAAVLGLSACAGGSGATPEQAAQAETLDAVAWQVAKSSETSGDYAQAARQYGMLARRHPDRLDAVLGQARNLRYAGNPAQSVLLLESALPRFSRAPELRLELAKAELARDSVSRAQQLLQELAAETPQDWQVPAVLGIALDRQGQREAARVQYARALDLNPREPQTINNLALSLAMDGELQAAVALLEEGVRQAGAPLTMKQNLALFYALSGEMAKAEALTRRNLPPEAAEKTLESYRKLAADRKPVAKVVQGAVREDAPAEQAAEAPPGLPRFQTLPRELPRPTAKPAH